VFEDVSFRSVCLTADPLLSRMLRRALGAAGGHVDVCATVEELLARAPSEMVVLDARRACEIDWARVSAWGAHAVVVVADSLEQDDVLALLAGAGIDHLMARADETEDDLVVTSGKVATGDIFGLEKYLLWGVVVSERPVRRYDEKRDALRQLADFAEEIGVRRQLVARIEAVADELLMNALYDAPAVRYGVEPRIAERARAGLGPLGDEPALVRWGCDGHRLALSVRDNYGELRKEAILEHLARARAGRGAPLARPGGGAGLGLYFVVSSVAGLVANISPGRATEMIALFDVKATGRESPGYARSLHIFTV
jgi:hypothetical protein